MTQEFDGSCVVLSVYLRCGAVLGCVVLCTCCHRSLFGFLSKFRRSPAGPSSSPAANAIAASDGIAATQHSAVKPTTAASNSDQIPSDTRDVDDSGTESDTEADNGAQEQTASVSSSLLPSALPTGPAASLRVLPSNKASASLSSLPAFRSSSLALSATTSVGRSSLAPAGSLTAHNHSSGSVRRGSSLHPATAADNVSLSGSGGGPLHPSLNAHSPLPLLTAIQPLAMIAQRKPLQPTGRMIQANRTAVTEQTHSQQASPCESVPSLTCHCVLLPCCDVVLRCVVRCRQPLSSRFLTDLGGDDSLSDDEMDDGPPLARTLQAAHTRNAPATAAVTARSTLRHAQPSSYTAPVSTQTIVDGDDDEFDF